MIRFHLTTKALAVNGTTIPWCAAAGVAWSGRPGKVRIAVPDSPERRDMNLLMAVLSIGFLCGHWISWYDGADIQVFRTLRLRSTTPE
jgi:hypothetical protein